MKHILSTDLSHENIETVLALLEKTPTTLSALTTGLSSEQLTGQTELNERSILGILAHLINCETLTTNSIYLALLKPEPLLHKLHPERNLGKLLRLDQFSYAELVAYFTFRRKVLLSVLQSLTFKQWGRTIREEGKQRQESVYWRARGQALHEMDHLDEIEAKIKLLNRNRS